MAAEAVLQTLAHAWKILDEAGVPKALMGGLAVAAWKHRRSTDDIDLLVAVELDDVDDVVQRLAASGVIAKRDPPLLEFGDVKLLQFVYEPPESYVELPIDLLIAQTPLQQSALARRTSLPVDGIDEEIDVVSCEDLILLKLLAGRLLDLADVAALLRANIAGLDRDYLGQWAKSLDLEALFADVWEQAIPGESWV